MSFTKFYSQNLDKVYRYVYCRCGYHTAQAEDLTQEIFMKAYQSFSTSSIDLSLSWLFKIARNHLIDYYRTSNSKINVSLDKVTLSCLSEGEKSLLKKEELEKLSQAMQKLSSTHKEIIILRYINEMPYKEIAQVLEISSGAARVRSHEAIKVLKKILLVK